MSVMTGFYEGGVLAGALLQASGRKLDYNNVRSLREQLFEGRTPIETPEDEAMKDQVAAYIKQLNAAQQNSIESYRNDRDKGVLFVGGELGKGSFSFEGDFVTVEEGNKKVHLITKVTNISLIAGDESFIIADELYVVESEKSSSYIISIPLKKESVVLHNGKNIQFNYKGTIINADYVRVTPEVGPPYLRLM